MLVEVVTDNVQAEFALRYPLERVPDEWEIPEVPVPESVSHASLVTYLEALLAAWAAARGHEVAIARNLAVRWVQARPRVGIDPDVAVIDPKPPAFESLRSLKLWEPGARAPVLAIEVVSPNHPYKDYALLPERYASMGVGELWVLDPGGFGPRRLGGPHFVQQFVRDDDGALVRRYAGSGPVYSRVVGGWVHRAPGTGVMLTDDTAGEQRWLTPHETEAAARAQEAAARAAAEHARDETARRAERLAARLRELGIDPDDA